MDQPKSTRIERFITPKEMLNLFSSSSEDFSYILGLEAMSTMIKWADDHGFSIDSGYIRTVTNERIVPSATSLFIERLYRNLVSLCKEIGHDVPKTWKEQHPDWESMENGSDKAFKESLEDINYLLKILVIPHKFESGPDPYYGEGIYCIDSR